MMKRPAGGHSAATGLAVAAAYALMSMSLALLNKSLLSSYKFPCFFFLLSLQLGLSLLFCIVTRDYLGNPFDIQRINRDTFRAAVPMSVAYVGNVAVGLVGLQLVNVPMFFAVRRLVPAFILAYERGVLGKVPELDVQVSAAVIAVGAILAGWESLGSDMVGYGITMANNAITACLFVTQKQFSSSTGTNTFGMVLINSAIALPLCGILAVLTGEVDKLLMFPHLWSPPFLASLLVASGMGLGLTYTSLLCTTYNSPLATSVTGNVKDLFTTTLGWWMFGGFKATLTSVAGLLLSFVGAGMYSFASLRKSQAAAAAAAVPSGGAGSTGPLDDTIAPGDGVQQQPLEGEGGGRSSDDLADPDEERGGLLPSPTPPRYHSPRDRPLGAATSSLALLSSGSGNARDPLEGLRPFTPLGSHALVSSSVTPAGPAARAGQGLGGNGANSSSRAPDSASDGRGAVQRHARYG